MYCACTVRIRNIKNISIQTWVWLWVWLECLLVECRKVEAVKDRDFLLDLEQKALNYNTSLSEGECPLYQ